MAAPVPSLPLASAAVPPLSAVADLLVRNVLLGSQTRLFKVYKNVATGEDIVQKMISLGLASGTEDAATLGNELIMKGYLVHAKDPLQPFKPKAHSIYRFWCHGGSGSEGEKVVTPQHRLVSMDSARKRGLLSASSRSARSTASVENIGSTSATPATPMLVATMTTPAAVATLDTDRTDQSSSTSETATEGTTQRGDLFTRFEAVAAPPSTTESVGEVAEQAAAAASQIPSKEPEPIKEQELPLLPQTPRNEAVIAEPYSERESAATLTVVGDQVVKPPLVDEAPAPPEEASSATVAEPAAAASPPAASSSSPQQASPFNRLLATASSWLPLNFGAGGSSAATPSTTTPPKKEEAEEQEQVKVTPSESTSDQPATLSSPKTTKQPDEEGQADVFEEPSLHEEAARVETEFSLVASAAQPVEAKAATMAAPELATPIKQEEAAAAEESSDSSSLVAAETPKTPYPFPVVAINEDKNKALDADTLSLADEDPDITKRTVRDESARGTSSASHQLWLAASLLVLIAMLLFAYRFAPVAGRMVASFATEQKRSIPGIGSSTFNNWFASFWAALLGDE
jgi:Domain found in Dishevelled, Egl-10, and Pleckstrin (DEP)